MIAGGAGGTGGTNASGGDGGVGVIISHATLTNSGTIAGGAGGIGSAGNGVAGDAVQFGAVAARLIVDPGAVFDGNVAANSSVNDVLKLAGTAAGMLSGIGTQFSGFTTITESAHAGWTLTGANMIGSATAFEDSGLLSVAGTLTDAGTASVLGQGTLQASGAGAVLLGGVALAGGTLGGEAAGTLVVGGSLAGAPSDTVTVASGAAITGFGTITGAAIVDNGTILAQDGQLTLRASVSGSGTVMIGNGATLAAAGALSVATINFGNDALLIAREAVTGTLSGFAAGDVIELRTIQANALNFANGTLTLSNHGVVVDSLAFAGSYTSGSFTLSADGHGGTDISFVDGASALRDFAPHGIDQAWREDAGVQPGAGCVALLHEHDPGLLLPGLLTGWHGMLAA